MVLGQKENVFFIYKIYAFTDITVRMTIASLIIVIILIAIMTMMVTSKLIATMIIIASVIVANKIIPIVVKMA